MEESVNEIIPKHRQQQNHGGEYFSRGRDPYKLKLPIFGYLGEVLVPQPRRGNPNCQPLELSVHVCQSLLPRLFCLGMGLELQRSNYQRNK